MLKRFWRRRGTTTLVLLAVLSLVAAGVYGQVSSRSDVEPEVTGVELYLTEALPRTTGFELVHNAPDDASYLYIGFDTNGDPVGYITVTKADAYRRQMTVMVGWSLEGTILTLEVPKHYEPRIRPLYDKEFFSQYIGRQYSEPLELRNDIDVVTRSTYSSKGVAMGVQKGRELVAQQLDSPYLMLSESVSFGLPEILLLMGLGSVVALRLVPGLKKFRWARYLTLTFGFFVLGTWLVMPLTLVDFTIWTVGFVPVWQSHLFLYILFFGVVGLAVVLAKNFYCFWLCPFSAVQEVMHFLGGGRVTPTHKCHRRLRNTPYFLLWLALFLALLLRDPFIADFEPWQTLFSLHGTVEQWLLVAVTLVAAMIVKDFWCHYLCPIRAVMNIILKVRRRLSTGWFQKVGPGLKETTLKTQ